ncbi:hypothetical protein AM593_08209, partial [Mytilus galloprovincialis]
MLQTAVSMRPDYVQGYINRGDIMVKLGRMKEAIVIYKTALKYEPDNADVYYNLGVVSLELKDPDAARVYFETALQHDPDHWQSLYNSAIMIQEHGNANDWPELEKRLQHLEKKNPTDPKIYFTMGMLDMDRKDYISAEKYIKKCLQYEPTFRSALFNLALMLVNNLNKPLEALPYLNTLLQNYPDHTKGMMLLGDINVNVQKDLISADKHFKRVVELEPDNIQANHNLCVVMVEKDRERLNNWSVDRKLTKFSFCLGYIHLFLIINEVNLHFHWAFKEINQKPKCTALLLGNQISFSSAFNEKYVLQN